MTNFLSTPEDYFMQLPLRHYTVSCSVRCGSGRRGRVSKFAQVLLVVRSLAVGLQLPGSLVLKTGEGHPEVLQGRTTSGHVCHKLLSQISNCVMRRRKSLRHHCCFCLNISFTHYLLSLLFHGGETECMLVYVCERERGTERGVGDSDEEWCICEFHVSRNSAGEYVKWRSTALAIHTAISLRDF